MSKAHSPACHARPSPRCVPGGAATHSSRSPAAGPASTEAQAPPAPLLLTQTALQAYFTRTVKMAVSVKVQSSRTTRAAVLRALGELFPGARLRQESSPAEGAWAIALTLPRPGKTHRLLLAFKSLGEPRYLAQAITVLTLGAARRPPQRYPVVAAPYIAPEGQRLCREAGVGYLDLIGNAFLGLDGVLIDRRTESRPPRARARLRRLVAPRSSRVLRVLLEQPKAAWTLTRLAEEATVSLRTAHLVVNALEEKAFVSKARGGIRLTQPGALLDLWAGQYDLAQHPRRSFYTFARNAREVARAIATAAVAQDSRLALTLHSGAALVAPFVRSPDVHAYVVGDLDRLIRKLDLRPADTGGSVHLLVPADEGVLYRTQSVDGIPVVCNTQLYLDLVNYPARGREQADELRRRKLGF